MSFFISDAMATGTAQQSAQQPDGMLSLIMLGAIFFVFYFMIIRPQQKRAKEQREMVGNLKKGDEIVTSGGMIGKIVNIDEQYIKVALAEGVEISMQRGAVSSVLPKGTLKSL